LALLYDIDKVQKQLDSDGHRTWDLVIYRCTYRSDSDWSEFIARFRTHVIKYLEFSEALNLLDDFHMTVFEDKSLDGARPAMVREKFNEWAKTAPQQEQNATAGDTVRYAWCIYVDDGALESIARKPDPDFLMDKSWGFVNPIQADWEPYDRFEGEDDLEEENEPIDGCTNHDTGWMRVRYGKVIPLAYRGG
jgi:hypothetical protein